MTEVGIAIRAPRHAPPAVRATEHDLAACLEDGAFAEATRSARGVVVIRSADNPQAVTARIGEAVVELAPGGAGNADVTAIVHESSPDNSPQIDGTGEHPELGEWAARLLNPPLPGWERAAERFWAVLSGRPGGPDALVVVELESGERRRYGSDGGRACELHGAEPGLVMMLTGRSSAIEAAFVGDVRLRGTFPDLSTLSGAGFEIRYGGARDDA